MKSFTEDEHRPVAYLPIGAPRTPKVGRIWFEVGAKRKIIMRINCLFALMFAGFLQTSLAANGQTVTFSKENANLEEVFKEIRKQTRYTFLYTDEIMYGAKPVTVNFRNTPIEEALKQCTADQQITFTISRKTVVIKRRPEPTGPALSPAPPITVTGKVLDNRNNALMGVSVNVKGTTIGTVTDGDGYFSVVVPNQKAILVFSFVGFDQQEVRIGKNTSINVQLIEKPSALNEVVVIGFGTKSKVNLAGAVSTINSQVLEARPITNSIAALQGAAPGLFIERGSGQPGNEEFYINIRGASSTNGGNSPLILIDGVIGDLNMVNPNDIESISVLKDASASIFGARAAGGVLLVTTKKGKSGAPKITYANNFSVSKLSGTLKLANHYQLAVMDNEANINNGATPMYTPELLERIKNNNETDPIEHPVYGSAGWVLFLNNTDWVKEVIGNGFQQLHNISVSGGGNNSNYYLSGGYSNQDGVMKFGNDKNERFNLRLNYDYSFSKKIRLETKISLENQNRRDNGSHSTIEQALLSLPNNPPYTQNGEHFFGQGGWGNALAQAKENNTSTYKTHGINTNFKLIADIANGLKLNLQSGINYTSYNNTVLNSGIPLYSWDNKNLVYYSGANPERIELTKESATNSYRNFSGYLQYSKVFGDKHDVDIMAGISHEKNDDDMFNATRDHFLNTALYSLNLGSSANQYNNASGSQWAINSLFSRLSYVYNKKYIVEANFRYDGSSRFEAKDRWGLFPGVAVAWRIGEEDFIKSTRIFDDLKLRVSYGETGNQEGIGLYDYIQLITVGKYGPDVPGHDADESKFYGFGNAGLDQTAFLSGMVANNRTWETLINQNAGLDASVLSSRLNFTFNYFIKKNKNLLIPVTYPSMLGSSAPFTNSGELKTWGFESSLEWKDKIGALQYSARVIFSDAKNELVDYGGADTYNRGYTRIREGYPLDSYFAYVYDGVIKDEKELEEYKKLGDIPNNIGIGDARYKDVDGNGKINDYGDSTHSGDLVNVGNSAPRYNFGLNLAVKYKNFDMSLFIQGVGKRTIFRDPYIYMAFSNWWVDPPAFYYGNTWASDRPNAYYPKLTHGDIRNWNYTTSTMQKVNGAYARLKNVQIGYNFNVKKLFTSARVYVSGENLFEIHNVKGGWDPESSTSGLNYPFQRYYSLGVNVTL